MVEPRDDRAGPAPASLDDIRLVLAIDETGSIGAAAATLHVSQPSASQRLAALERRIGADLVERDTTGARLTRAGALFAEHGRSAVELVGRAVSDARSPAGRRLRVGTTASLAPVVVPALLALLADHHLDVTTDHGRHLTRRVADGDLDGTLLGLEPAEAPASGVRRLRVGLDDLVLVGALPADPPRRRPLTGTTVAAAGYGHEHGDLAARLVRLGGAPLRVPTVSTALALVRASGWLAAVPRSSLDPAGMADREAPTRLGVAAPLWLVTRGPAADALVAAAPRLARDLRLRSATRPGPAPTGP